ncbi:MAG TPA: hypothetical protein VIY28_17780 [Pseudonocardiaceae bacterium]
MPPAEGCESPAGASPPGSGAAGATAETAEEAAQKEAAQRRFLRDLQERGEIVPEGEELPPGATHELVEGHGDEPPKVRRRRFSAT